MTKTIKPRWILASTAVAVIAAYAAWAQLVPRTAPEFQEARIVASFPHDPQAFTQGLTFHNGRLFEGTGQYGSSSIRRVDYRTGVVEKIRQLNRIYFGEGIAIMGDKLFQLTWQNQIGAIYDIATFDLIDTFVYEGEGWGLTHDGHSLILSNGSSTIQFLDPATFTVERTIDVSWQDTPVERLNELEFIDNEIWANIWYEDRIARIAPSSGQVVGWVDVSKLYPKALRGRDDVANGIAYDDSTGRLFVTGKNWPQLYEIELIPAR